MKLEVMGEKRVKAEPFLKKEGRNIMLISSITRFGPQMRYHRIHAS